MGWTGEVLATRGVLARTAAGDCVRSRRRSTAVAAAVAGVLVVLVTVVAAPAASARAVQDDGQVDENSVSVTVEGGVGGKLVPARFAPVRVVLESPRSITVDVSVGSQDGASAEHRVEVLSSGPTTLDTAVEYSEDVRVVVTRDGDVVGREAARLERLSRVGIVALGASLAPGAPEGTATIADVSDAALIPLQPGDIERPAMLGQFGQIVMSAADVEALSSSETGLLRHWVAAGGTLTIDSAPTDPLPVVELAGSGRRTAVGAGWVTFSEGDAAAGSWDSVAEPPTVTAGSAFQDGFDGGFDGGLGGGFSDGVSVVGEVAALPLVDTEFTSAWVIAGVAFGSIVVVGPVLWMVLGSRRRRPRMWFLAPGLSLVIAAGLAVVGGGDLSARTVRPFSFMNLDPWGASGDVASATIGSQQMELGPGAFMVVGSEGLVSTSDGSLATVDSSDSSDEYGYFAAADLTIDEPVGFEATARRNRDGSVTVRVANTVEGTSGMRLEAFVDGKSRTASVDAGEITEFDLGGPRLNTFRSANVCLDEFCTPPGWGSFDRPVSDGVVTITAEPDAVTPGLLGEGATPQMQTVVPIADADDVSGTATLVRIDELVDRDDPSRDPFLVQPEIVPGQEPQRFPGYLRMTSPSGRPASTCAIHTVANAPELWTGSGWAPLTPVGEPFDNPNWEAPNNAQSFQVPAMAAGEALYLRLQLFAPPGAPLIDCGEQT